MKKLAKGETWTAPDTTIYGPIPAHLISWFTRTLHEQYKQRIAARAAGYTPKP